MVPSGYGETRNRDVKLVQNHGSGTLIEAILERPISKHRSGRVGLGSLGLGTEVGRGAAGSEEAADQRREEGVEDDLSAAVLCQYCLIDCNH